MVITDVRVRKTYPEGKMRPSCQLLLMISLWYMTSSNKGHNGSSRYAQS